MFVNENKGLGISSFEIRILSSEIKTELNVHQMDCYQSKVIVWEQSIFPISFISFHKQNNPPFKISPQTLISLLAIKMHVCRPFIQLTSVSLSPHPPVLTFPGVEEATWPRVYTEDRLQRFAAVSSCLWLYFAFQP